MPEDPRDAVAVNRARADQDSASVRDMAGLLVTFRETLIQGHFTSDLADVLTRDYFDALLYGQPREEDE